MSGGAGAIATPAVSASAGTGGCTPFGCPGGGISVIVTATVVYQMAVVAVGAPSGLRVLYNFETNGGITAIASNGNLGMGSVHVSLTGPTAGFEAETIFDPGPPPGQSCGPGLNPHCINDTTHVSLLVNTPYTIEVFATAGVGGNSQSSVVAEADPYIYIDPSVVNADQFTLVISDGVGNAPLTSTSVPVLPRR